MPARCQVGFSSLNFSVVVVVVVVVIVIIMIMIRQFIRHRTMSMK